MWQDGINGGNVSVAIGTQSNSNEKISVTIPEYWLLWCRATLRFESYHDQLALRINAVKEIGLEIEILKADMLKKNGI